MTSAAANPSTGFVSRIKGKSLFSPGTLTQFGVGGATMRSDGTLYANQSSTGIQSVSTTLENTLDSYSLPANSLDVAGRSLLITAFGKLGNNTHTKTVTLYFGTATTVAAVTNTTAFPWMLSMIVMKDASNTQAIYSQAMSASATPTPAIAVAAGAEPDTAAIVIKVTGTTVTAATGDVVLNGFIVQALD